MHILTAVVTLASVLYLLVLSQVHGYNDANIKAGVQLVTKLQAKKRTGDRVAGCWLLVSWVILGCLAGIEVVAYIHI